MMSHSRRGFTKLGAVLILSLGLILVPAPTSATNWYGATGSSPCGGNAPDWRHHFYFSREASLSTTMFNEIAWSINNRIAPTAVDVEVEYTGDINFRYMEANYGPSFCGLNWHPTAGGMVAYTSCTALDPAGDIWCDNFNIYIDQSWEINAAQSARRNLATHETGHALGLKHTTNISVMNDWANTSFFHSHDHTHLNFWYN
jgi:hypothetical protein